jgi:hypothetical protein
VPADSRYAAALLPRKKGKRDYVWDDIPRMESEKQEDWSSAGDSCAHISENSE